MKKGQDNRLNIVSEGSPKYVTLGAHYRCNANCVFCLGGDYPDFSLEIYKNFFEPKLLDVMRRAEHVGFCGYGEVLLMPGITEFLDYINIKSLPDVTKVFTTNGLPLEGKTGEKLTEGRYSLIVSLHASNEKLHRLLLGRKGFKDIINNIKELVRVKEKNKSPLHINLSFLMTNYNIEDLPDFIRMAGDLGADRVSCNYLTVFTPEQLRMSCFFQKDKTSDILREAEETAEEIGMDLALPPRFGDDAIPDSLCDDPWNFFYVEVQGSVLPCCFAGDHIGYLNRNDFSDIWNSEGYLRLREGLIKDEPYEWCKDCYRYRRANVNKIESHITFRPETRKKILEYIEKNGYERIKSEIETAG